MEKVILSGAALLAFVVASYAQNTAALNQNGSCQTNAQTQTGASQTSVINQTKGSGTTTANWGGRSKPAP